MPITQEDFEDITITFNRVIRTGDSEQYIILADNPDAGFQLHEKAPHESRVGHIIIQYTEGQLSRPFVSGALILEAEWDDSPAENLTKKIDREIVSSIGAGSRHRRQTFDVEIFVAESIGGITDAVTEDEDRGLYGIHNQFEKTQTMVETLPNEFSETVEEVVETRYEEIEDIIESNVDKEEKMEQIRDRLTIGLERGLPTILYENEVSE